jgi:hypothetical protein
MKHRVFLAVTTAMVGTALFAGSAVADVSPPGCLSNSLDLAVTKDRLTVRNGDTVNFTVSAENTKDTPCDLTGATIKVTLPGPSGAANGQVITIASNINIPAGSVLPRLKTIPWVVALDPGVTVATVEATADGDLHDVAVGLRAVHIVKTLGTGSTQPGLSLTKTASTTGGTAPLPVTYTYTTTNISTTPVPLANAAVTDDLCAPVTYAGGDANANALLDVGETFTFTCSTTHTSPGTYVDTANACGDSTIDNQKVCAPPKQATVVVTAPPVFVAQSKPSKCISVPKTLSVRAKELTTVKVTVTTGTIAGASIKLTGPGISRSGKTNSKGTVTFHVRPTKKGTLTIKSDSCLDAQRVSVKSARKTQSRRVPRVTG